MFSPQKIFMPISFGMLALGASMLGYNIVIHRIVNNAAVILGTVGAFTFFFGLLADQIAHIRRELSRTPNLGSPPVESGRRRVSAAHLPEVHPIGAESPRSARITHPGLTTTSQTQGTE